MVKLTIEQLQKALEPVFSSEPSVGFVYLFGSQARGDVHAQSDYDIAVYFDPTVSARHEVLFRLEGAISKTLQSDQLDVKSLNDIREPELRYHIIQEGILLYERGPYRLIIEPRILNEYFDFTYLLKKYDLTKQAP